MNLPMASQHTIFQEPEKAKEVVESLHVALDKEGILFLFERRASFRLGCQINDVLSSFFFTMF